MSLLFTIYKHRHVKYKMTIYYIKYSTSSYCVVD